MDSLIYDQSACQPWSKRLLCNTLTGAGWTFWLYLCSPFFFPLTAALSLGPQHLHVSAWAGQALLVSFLSHLTLITMCVAIFVVFAVFQERRQHGASQAPYTETINTGSLARSIGLRASDLTTWQQAQSIVVTHDEALGWIHDVEVFPMFDRHARSRELVGAA